MSDNDPVATIVAAYLAQQGSKIEPNDLPVLIARVRASLGLTDKPASVFDSAAHTHTPDALEPAPEAVKAPEAASGPETRQEPAVPIKSSVKPDYLVCLECGKTFKSLKRHIGSDHGLTTDAYKEKWGLPKDYPFTAPNYSAARSELAKSLGLGRKADGSYGGAKNQPRGEPFKEDPPRTPAAQDDEDAKVPDELAALAGVKRPAKTVPVKAGAKLK